MQHDIRAIFLAVLAASIAPCARADSTWVYAVQVSASAQSSPAKLTLSWVPDQYGANSYTVYRKGAGDGAWSQLAVLPGSTATYVDQNVTAGAAYEYQIVKAASLGYTGYGYIYAGMAAPLAEQRGKVILVVDSTHASSLASELAQLQSDLVGDGWTVRRHDVARNDTPANVKNLILADYRADPANVKAVLLFGHVPILRCGNLNVDGHQARPMPADAFYGDMDGAWNNPSYLPSDVELMVGRVDLANMPGQGAAKAWPGEGELLRNYLKKDHQWRHKQVTVPRKAVLGNRFGDFGGEAFAASGFRSLEPLVGSGNIVLANEQDNAPAAQRWSSMLAAGTYLWAYGCGGGSYTSMSFMGTHGSLFDIWSIDLVDQDAKAVFVMMMGSWLGEWDSADNIMRAVLATPSLGLTCSWSGRPHWFYHHMGLGEPIGHSARASMNNGGLYRSQVNNFARGVHIALMGDPTLRLHQVAPPAGLAGNATASLSWSPSAEAVAGYHVYRAAKPEGPFTRVNSALVTGTTYQDATAAPGGYTYMVRAVKMENTPSGTYLNASQGAFAQVTVATGSSPVKLTVARAANGIRLSWNSEAGKRYTVQAKNQLSDASWQTLSSPITATNPTTTWTESAPSAAGARVYRVVAE